MKFLPIALLLCVITSCTFLEKSKNRWFSQQNSKDKGTTKDDDLAADEIIAKHFYAIGGPHNKENVKSVFEEFETDRNGSISYSKQYIVTNERTFREDSADKVITKLYYSDGACLSGFEVRPGARFRTDNRYEKVITHSFHPPYLYGKGYYSWCYLLKNYNWKGITVMRVDKPDDESYILRFALPHDNDIVLYIDPNTFLVTMSNETITNLPGCREIIRYSNFKVSKALTYPTHYQIDIYDAKKETFDLGYSRTVSNVVYNLTFPDSLFIPSKDALEAYYLEDDGSNKPYIVNGIKY